MIIINSTILFITIYTKHNRVHTMARKAIPKTLEDYEKAAQAMRESQMKYYNKNKEAIIQIKKEKYNAKKAAEKAAMELAEQKQLADKIYMAVKTAAGDEYIERLKDPALLTAFCGNVGGLNYDVLAARILGN